MDVPIFNVCFLTCVCLCVCVWQGKAVLTSLCNIPINHQGIVITQNTTSVSGNNNKQTKGFNWREQTPTMENHAIGKRCDECRETPGKKFNGRGREVGSLEHCIGD